MSQTTTCQVWRLEMQDSVENHYKQYTAILCPGQPMKMAGVAIFAYSRIGAKWQWSVRPGGDTGGAVASQLNSKRAKGYVDVWHGDVTIPWDWTTDPKANAVALQDFIERAYREGATHARVGTSVSDGETRSVLASLVDDLAGCVSKLATNPDAALHDYSRLVGEVEAAQADWHVALGYMDALRAMLAAGGNAA